MTPIRWISRRPRAVTLAGTMAAVALAAAGCGSSSSSSGSAASSASSHSQAAGAYGAAPATSSAAQSSSPAAGSGAAGAGHHGKATVMLAGTAHGQVLVDGAGATLYLWMADKGGRSVCTGACASAWPPLTVTGKPTAGTGVSAGRLSTSKRSDGGLQVTYAGHPLYTFAGDTSPGQANGQGSDSFGAEWWLVSADGQAITK